jgi:mannose-1-phosphate guanylyltransferase
MLEESVLRALNVFDADKIFIITGEHLVQPIKDVLKIIPAENILAEPSKRNTAPCLALSAAYLIDKFGPAENISMAVLTADHIMETDQQFTDTVNDAMDYVENNNVIATIGIKPSRPETGYGYIELNNELQKDKAEIFKVNQFKEKPQLEIAKEYLSKGNYLWNSGMFFWRLDTFLNQLSKHLPEVGNEINNIAKNIESRKYIEDAYNAFPSISIDFGLMEKADEVVCVKALFDWDDLGDLNSLERTKQIDESGNIKIGKNSVINCKNSTIINVSSKDKIIATALGIDNLVIVVTDDAVLVANKNDVQKVKEIVEDIKLNYEGICL